jgi:hypothetical protein
VHGVIERQLDDVVERERPEASGPLGDESAYLTSDAASPRRAKSWG